MASAAVVTAVKNRLISGWTLTPIIDPNTDGETPDNAANFLTVQYPVSNERHVGMAQVGNRSFREDGVIRFVLSVARGGGLDQALAWAETLRNLFRAQQFDGVSCLAASPPFQNDTNDVGNYYVLSIIVPYYYTLYA